VPRLGNGSAGGVQLSVLTSASGAAIFHARLVAFLCRLMTCKLGKDGVERIDGSWTRLGKSRVCGSTAASPELASCLQGAKIRHMIYARRYAMRASSASINAGIASNLPS
jgi:hypothetical protein